MSFEFSGRPLSLQKKSLELSQNDENEDARQEELSLEKLAHLQQGIETLERQLSFALGWENEATEREALEEIQKAFLENPKIIQEGLQNKETSLSTIYLIEMVWDVVRKQRDEKVQHFSNRNKTEKEELSVFMESQIIASEAYIQTILKDEDNSSKNLIFEMMTGLLDSSEEHHRAYGESMLMNYSSDLARNLLDQETISEQDEIVHIWQEIFLRFENTSNVRRMCLLFKLVCERRIEREEKKQKKQREDGEEVSKGREWVDLYHNILKKIFSVYHPLFEPNKDLLLEATIDLVGLDGYKMIDKWVQVGDTSQEREYGPGYQYAYARNLQSLYELKQASSEAPKVLASQFNISHFGRYTKETLLRQYEEREEKGPYGVIFFPVADHNGAFFGSAFKFDQLQKTLLEGGYKMRIMEAGSKGAIARQMIRLDREYGQGKDPHKIGFLILGGHGSEDRILFGEGRDKREELTKEDVSGRGIERGIRKFLVPEAETILFSCSTGLEGGIGEEMWKELGLLVQAPKYSASVSQISVSFAKEGNPVFVVKYQDKEGNQIPTMSYRATASKDNTLVREEYGDSL